MCIPADIAEEIKRRIARIEAEEDVAVLLAVESGSRAWGFASVNSDYDARFIYLRRTAAYLRVHQPRDVIERPIVDEIDLNGWDLRKALGLLLKSNPPLLEWLQSPIIYREQTSVAAQMRALLPAYYSPNASFHHYLHMAQRTLDAYLLGPTVKRKKYFYVLRPVLAMQWIDNSLGAVPMEFEKLVDATVTDASVRAAIAQLLEGKRAGNELDESPRDPVLSEFVEREIARLGSTAGARKDPAPPVEKLDELFRAAVREQWGAELPR